MNPIINPWVFYWISVLSNIQTILVIVLIITVAATIILGIMTATEANVFLSETRMLLDMANGRLKWRLYLL